MAFGGLWEGYRWPDETIIRTFTVVTTSASPDIAGLHDRMPVILEPWDWSAWHRRGFKAILPLCLLPAPGGHAADGGR